MAIVLVHLTTGVVVRVPGQMFIDGDGDLTVFDDIEQTVVNATFKHGHWTYFTVQRMQG